MTTPSDHTYGPQVPNEMGLKRLCRLQQSWYRVERLGAPLCGPYEPGRRVVGSALLNGEESGNNFLSEAALRYANEKLEEKRVSNPDLTIKKYRLFNNMLSSQPMCFNLFGDLHAGVVDGDVAATDVLRAMFADMPLATIQSLEVEHLPQPKAEYIKDKTAFDASIRFRDAAGNAGIITIETKYTDSLGKGSARELAFQLGLLKAWQMCTPAGLAYYEKCGIPQVLRNLLLTIAFQRRHELSFATNYIVGLRGDTSVQKAITDLHQRLAPEYAERIQVLPLELLLERAQSVATGPYARVQRAFWERYLDLGQARALLAGASRRRTERK